MNKSKFYLLICMSLILSKLAMTAEITQLMLTSSVCELDERGFMSKKDPIIIKGSQSDILGCVAIIYEDDFDKKFKACSYSGFDILNGKNAEFYSCRYSLEIVNGKNAYMFNAYMSKEGIKGRLPDITCHYMCFKK